MFHKRGNFRAAAKVFTQWSLPPEQLILLFADLFPKRYIDDLMQMFPELHHVAKMIASATNSDTSSQQAASAMSSIQGSVKSQTDEASTQQNIMEETKNPAEKAVDGGKKMVSALKDKVSQLLKTNASSDKRHLNAAKELQGARLVSIKEFLTLFRQKRDELHIEILRLKEKLNQNQESYGTAAVTNSILQEKQKAEYVLILVNMFLFHSHILLRKSDDRRLISSEEK